jgi:hypothetical protein
MQNAWFGITSQLITRLHHPKLQGLGLELVIEKAQISASQKLSPSAPLLNENADPLPSLY